MAEDGLTIILLGKKSWAAKALEFLVEQGHRVIIVVGREMEHEQDRKNGTLLEAAETYKIQTANINELYGWLKHPQSSPVPIKNVDLVISYLFWDKIKAPLLALPKIGAINFHPAPLPDLRGLGGYNKAILENRDWYGVTAHYMSLKIDEGDIIKVRKFQISRDKETALSLERKSQEEMFMLFKEVILKIQKGLPLERIKQNAGEGIYINREQFEKMKYITPGDDEEMIRRKIRAFWFPPYDGAKVEIAGKYFTVIDEQILNEISKIF